MSSTYTGDPTSVSNSLSATITNATNASPIVITTSADHLFASHDVVTISGVGGNTAANGSFVITKLSGTSFSLTGSTGSGAYTSGGTAVDNSLTPQAQIPSDGDVLSEADFLPALEALFDRSQFLALLGKMRSKAWTSDTTWTAPSDVQPIGFLLGYGGGGGGAAGGSGSTTANDQGVSGGAGGGSIQSVQVVTLTAGETYTVDIGAGGAAASDGADTTFADHTAAILARFKGAGRGYAGNLGVAATPYSLARGGDPVPNTFLPSAVAGSTISLSANGYAVATFVRSAPSSGGPGASSIICNGVRGVDGNASPQGYAGGSGGTPGTDSGTRIGGGGGGGGGAGPGGVGAAGGAGGNGNAVTATNGSAGASAAANTGAGGGGGGAGGGAGTTVGTGGAGGAGGSGKLTLFYFGSPT